MLKQVGLKLMLAFGMIFVQTSRLHSSQIEWEQFNMSVAFDRSAWQVDHDLFVIHAIPKCGTHYIQRTIHLMTNQTIINRNINQAKLAEACASNQILRSFQPYHSDLTKILKETHHKAIAMVRDPRDALISHVFYMRDFPKNPNGDNTKRDFFTVGADFDELSLEQQITSLIVGDEHAQSYIDFYKERTGWALNSKILTIKYEDLLGTAGGGDDAIKRAKVIELAHFIHLDLTNEQLENVLDKMYVDYGDINADGKVFERSTTGNWRTFLTPKQKSLIKKRIGKELIRLGYAEDNNW